MNREGVGIILDLLDQLHGMRRALRGVLDARRAGSERRRTEGRGLSDIARVRHPSFATRIT